MDSDRGKSLSLIRKSVTNLLSWPKSERPRERLLAQGVESLSLAELLAILLGHGRAGENVLQLAQRILSSANLAKSNLMDFSRLRSVPGVGTAKAARIIAGIELGRRMGRVETDESPRLNQSRAVVEFLADRLTGRPFELFLVLSVDVKNRPLSVDEVARGASESVTFSPRDLFQRAISAQASGIICAHNHPSGDPDPSAEDVVLTKRLVDGAKLLGIRFLDHLIIGSRERYFSFADEGRLGGF